jgi:hypothetical protein
MLLIFTKKNSLGAHVGCKLRHIVLILVELFPCMRQEDYMLAAITMVA